MNQIFESPRASDAGEKISEVFHGKIALRRGGVGERVQKKESAVGHGKISHFVPAAGVRFFQSPNQSPEPTLTVRPFSFMKTALETPSSLWVSVAHL